MFNQTKDEVQSWTCVGGCWTDCGAGGCVGPVPAKGLGTVPAKGLGRVPKEALERQGRAGFGLRTEGNLATPRSDPPATPSTRALQSPEDRLGARTTTTAGGRTARGPAPEPEFLVEDRVLLRPRALHAHPRLGRLKAPVTRSNGRLQEGRQRRVLRLKRRPTEGRRGRRTPRRVLRGGTLPRASPSHLPPARADPHAHASRAPTSSHQPDADKSPDLGRRRRNRGTLAPRPGESGWDEWSALQRHQ